VRRTPTYSVENLSALELFASIICESAGAHFIGVQKPVQGASTLVLFCAANVPHEMQTTCALPLFECSTHSIREHLRQALEEFRESENRGTTE
jgi:hypothetical protein